MSRRLFLPPLTTGPSATAAAVDDRGRPLFSPSVRFTRQLAGAPQADQVGPFAGPRLAVVGPGDLVGFDPGQVVRCDPPPGEWAAEEHVVVSLDLADARLPWLTDAGGPRTGNRRPWLALVVVRDDEGRLTPSEGGLPPRITPAPAALPDPRQLGYWAHVEARLEDGDDVAAAVTAEATRGTDRVVARLLCPRKLDPNRRWLACVVPTTAAGREAGLGRQPTAAHVGRTAWEPNRSETLPVYHWWEFGTGDPYTFEDLARRVTGRTAADLAAEFPTLGGRVVDVGHPWPGGDDGAPEGTPPVTVTVAGAIRVPRTGSATETWTDDARRTAFVADMTAALNAPARLRTPGAQPDRDARAVAPPLRGSHHTGHQRLPAVAWLDELNLQARHRIVASLGARYVQLEQEFLMEQAWEHVGEVREANRLLATTQLAAEATEAARVKHVLTMDATELTVMADVTALAAPSGEQDGAGLVARPVTMAGVLTASAVPGGAATTGFRRLARSRGALARRGRRVRRAAGRPTEAATDSVLAAGLGGTAVVPLRPVETLAVRNVEPGGGPEPVAADGASAFGGRTLAGLLGAQQDLVAARVGDAGAGAAALETFVRSMADAGSAMSLAGGATSGMVSAPPPPIELRSLRCAVAGVALHDVAPLPTEQTGVEVLAGELRTVLAPRADFLARVDERFVDGLGARPADDATSLRPIMCHPRFGFPVGAELLSRWPEWTLPGIGELPPETCTVMETNPAFVEALLVGLNHELNRELLWREYPTDQRGTPFTRFWPGTAPAYGEIAHWSGGPLGSHDPRSGQPQLVFLIRAEVIRRYPGTTMAAVRADAVTRGVPTSGGEWKHPQFTLAVDEQTCLYGFDLDEATARSAPWLFVLREPMRGTRFGFDLASSAGYDTWSDLTWDRVLDERGFARVGEIEPPASPGGLVWGPRSTPAQVAAIAYQRPFQLAFSPGWLIKDA